MHSLCMRAAKSLASLRICADSPQPSLLDNAMSAGLSCAGPYALDSDCV